MSDRQQQRAEAFAIGLGIGLNQAKTVLREFARLLDRQLADVPAGRHSAEQRLLLERASAGDSGTAGALADRLGCDRLEAGRFARAAAYHFIDGAECDAAETGRRAAACLADELRSAREWLSKGEQYEIEQALWRIMERRAQALGKPELLTSKDGRRQLYRQAYRELRDGVGAQGAPAEEPGARVPAFPLPGSVLRRGPW